MRWECEKLTRKDSVLYLLGILVLGLFVMAVAR